MRCSLDKVLLDARQLANKIRATDETADMLIKQASVAHNKIISKKQCQEEIMSFEQLSQIASNRPRNRLMMCIATENKQLELLKQENKVLRTSLIEYEKTFDIIMKKFRKHKNILKKLDQLEQGDLTAFSQDLSVTHVESINSRDNQILLLCFKITQLQKNIEKSLFLDNRVTDDLSEIESKLLFENQELRRLIEINEEIKVEFQNSSSLSSKEISTSENHFFRISKLESHNPSSSICSTQNSVGVTILNGGTKGPKNQQSVQCSKSNRVVKTASSLCSPGKLKNDIYSNMISVPSSSSSSLSSSFSDDDDDHSSIASDASVKTLI